MPRVLVVDDEVAIRGLIAAYLEPEGFDVIQASDGRIAKTIIGEQPVDLVIADLFMVDGEGLDLIISLRREHPEIKVLAISGGGRETGLRARDMLDMAEGLGAHRSLVKPFGQATLLGVVKELLAE